MHGSRKFHSKSRNGCGQCKKRHVRCDLQPPVCSNCRRRKEPCDFKAATGDSPRLPVDSNVAYHPSRLTATTRFEPVQALAQLSHQDRVSMSPPSTCSSASSPGEIVSSQDAIVLLLEKIWLDQPHVSPMEKSLWGQELEIQAQRFRYLGPAASSLFALHQSLQGGRDSSSRLRADAIHFNIEASNLFCGSQPQITEENWLAVMIFGVGVMIFHFATAMSSAIQDIRYVELFHLLRHTCTLQQAVRPYFLKSTLKVFIDRRQGMQSFVLDEDTRQAVQRLHGVRYPADTPEDARRACRQAISALQAWTRETEGHPRTWIHFVRWQGSVTDEFAALVGARHPVALLVFVYWCAIMRRIPKRWFLDGLWDRIACAVMMELPEEWDDMLEWPREAMSTRPGVVHRIEEMV